MKMLGLIDPEAPLLTERAPIQVEMHEDLEEEAEIQSVQPLQFSKLKRCGYWVLVLLSGGLLLLLDTWFLGVHVKFAYKPATLKSATHLLVSTRYSSSVCPLRRHQSWQELLTFTFQHLPYCYDGSQFVPLCFEGKTTYAELIDRYSTGYSTEAEVEDLRALFGLCAISVPVPSYFVLFYQLFMNPFYMFQVFSVALWFWDGYYYYAAAIFLTTVVSLILSLYQTHKNMVHIHELAKHSSPVKVFRREWIELSSEELVPGDLVQIADESPVPCDLVLTSGGCVMEEGMLTGESVPVMKEALPYRTTAYYRVLHDKRYTLYEGTHVIQTRSYSNSPVTGVVMRTGFQSMKGRLIRSILFPKPTKFKFYRDALLFVAVLAIIAVLGFLAVLPLQVAQGVPVADLVDRSLDLLTVSVPPALPAAMAVGTAFAILRLKGRGIYCIAPPKVNVSGNIDTYVFDKTGTLTEDGMELHGVWPVAKGEIHEYAEDIVSLSEGFPELVNCMASCHSLTIVRGSLMGDTQDLQIFRSTGWVYELPDHEVYDPAVQAIVKPSSTRDSVSDIFDAEGHVVNMIDLRAQLGILHIFHFSSALKRMGVVVKALNNGETLFYLKGAPEVVLNRCKSHTIPAAISQELRILTSKGYRVLACAFRNVEVDYSDLRESTITQFDQDLTFVGLIVLQNKLKPETIPEIQRLQHAAIRTIMATGDALLTAVCVGREANFVDSDSRLLVGEFDSSLNTEPLQGLQWTHAATGEPSATPWSQYQLTDPIQLAVTGEAFSAVVKAAEKSPADAAALTFILDKCRVYARMAPEHKSVLVEQLQQQGHMVGMCGDGANDCGALKCADIGISLSEAETSVAAPFTSKTPNIECVGIVLREGRCALVTSMQIFKFIALYSTIQFISVCTLYSIGSNLSDPQFTCIDLITILPLAVTMSYTKPYHTLSKAAPCASLVSIGVLFSVIGQTVLAGLAQILGYYLVTQQSFYSPMHYDEGQNVDAAALCDENTVVFLVSWYQYLSICLVYSIGKPWKQPAYTNVYLVVNALILFVAIFYCIIWPAAWIEELLGMRHFPLRFRLVILGLCLGYTVVSYALDKYCVFHIDQASRRRARRKLHQTKARTFSGNY